jgi:hypothetical protein
MFAQRQIPQPLPSFSSRVIRSAEPRDIPSLSSLLVAHGLHGFDLAASLERGHMFVLELGRAVAAAAHVTIEPQVGRARRARARLHLLVLDPTLPDAVARSVEEQVLRLAFVIAETYGGELEIPAPPYVTWRTR